MQIGTDHRGQRLDSPPPVVRFLCGSGKVAAQVRSRRHRSRSMKRKFKAGLTPSSPMSCHWGPFGVMIQYLPLCLHDFDVAVYRSPLPSVTQRNKCEVGKTPRSAIDHRQRTFLQSSSASRFTADASAFFILSAATIPIAALSPGSPHHANECQDDHHDDDGQYAAARRIADRPTHTYEPTREAARLIGLR